MSYFRVFSETVTYLFTFPTTKKHNLSRQLVDAESEYFMMVVFNFAMYYFNLKTDGPDGIELGIMMLMKNSLVLIIVGLVLITLGFSSCRAMAVKKTVYVTPERAKIFYNGHEVGNGSYEVSFKNDEDFAVLKFEAPGYIPRTVKLFKNNPKNTVSYDLFVDEAMQNSVGVEEGVDIANKYFTITCKKDMDDDIVWKRLMNIAVTNFENVEVRDKSAGWIKTAWVNTSFLYQVVRTRLEIQLQFADTEQKTYRVRLSSEIADKDCGLNDQCFVKYERVLKKYEQVISELQTSLGSNL